MTSGRILVAEDDPHIREGLVTLLESEGWQVAPAVDGREALARWREGRFDLLILDVMMPECSGYDVCREIRRAGDRVPVIMLTAKSEEIDRVVGLELGADDYVTKPFGVRELLARISAVLRRCGTEPDRGAGDPSPATEFTMGSAVVSRRSMRVSRDDCTWDLTPRELALLEYFHARPGTALSRRELLEEVWGYRYTSTTRTLDQHVAQLRKKIEPCPADPTVITTVHGVGYRYEGT